MLFLTSDFIRSNRSNKRILTGILLKSSYCSSDSAISIYLSVLSENWLESKFISFSRSMQCWLSNNEIQHFLSFQRWYQEQVQMLCTWLTDRLDRSLHPYQCTCLGLIVKVPILTSSSFLYFQFFKFYFSSLKMILKSPVAYTRFCIPRLFSLTMNESIMSINH